LSLTDPSSARQTPRGISENGKVRHLTNYTEPGLEHSDFIWVICSYPVTAVGLERILEKESRVYLGRETPKVGIPSSVVLCASDTESLPKSVERVQKLYPEASILVFGPHADRPQAYAALKAGARGYIHAGMKPDQLVRALRVASKGEIVAPRKLLEYLVSEANNGASADLVALSPRQREILGLVADGLSNAQIANRLYLSESTIKQHLRATYKLLRVRNRAQAARLFHQDTRDADRPGP
jgi:DNA-binding NarL/FixJ family response regulator